MWASSPGLAMRMRMVKSGRCSLWRMLGAFDLTTTSCPISSPRGPYAACTQSDVAQGCTVDCSGLTLEANCIRWGISYGELYSFSTKTTSTDAASLCPLGNNAPPACQRCSAGNYLVRAWCWVHGASCGCVGPQRGAAVWVVGGGWWVAGRCRRLVLCKRAP